MVTNLWSKLNIQYSKLELLYIIMNSFWLCTVGIMAIIQVFLILDDYFDHEVFLIHDDDTDIWLWRIMIRMLLMYDYDQHEADVWWRWWYQQKCRCLMLIYDDDDNDDADVWYLHAESSLQIQSHHHCHHNHRFHYNYWHPVAFSDYWAHPSLCFLNLSLKYCTPISPVKDVLWKRCHIWFWVRIVNCVWNKLWHKLYQKWCHDLCHKFYAKNCVANPASK